MASADGTNRGAVGTYSRHLHGNGSGDYVADWSTLLSVHPSSVEGVGLVMT